MWQGIAVEKLNLNLFIGNCNVEINKAGYELGL